MPQRNTRFQRPTRFQSCLKYSIPHGATAAHTCLRLLEIPKGLLPSSSNTGTISPINGPATYQGSGCGNHGDICSPLADVEVSYCTASVTRQAAIDGCLGESGERVRPGSDPTSC